MTLQEQLRRELRKAVAHSGKSQASITRALGLSKDHLNGALNGRRSFSMALAERVADECGFDLTISGKGRWTGCRPQR